MSDDQLDPQVAFFLEYEEYLRKWMALEYAARAAFDTFMHSLAPDLELLAAEIGDDVQVTDSGDERWGDYGVLGLFLPEWIPIPGELPVVAVGLVWHRRKQRSAGSPDTTRAARSSDRRPSTAASLPPSSARR
jgi:hypothetical protein